jgi:hypothetical protein
MLRFFEWGDGERMRKVKKALAAQKKKHKTVGSCQTVAIGFVQGISPQPDCAWLFCLQVRHRKAFDGVPSSNHLHNTFIPFHLLFRRFSKREKE